MEATSPSSRPSHQDDILIPDDIGIVGRLFQANVDVLTHTLREAKTGSNVSSTDQRALMRILQSLVLWGESNDIESGALDATLQRSRRLLRATLSPLRSMGLTLTKGIVPIAFGLSTFLNIIRESDMDILLDAARATVESEDYIQQVSSESEDSTDELTGCDKIESHVRDLQIFMRCLVDLTETLASAVPDPHYDDPKPVQVESLEPHHLYAGLIREKFPFGDVKIVDHLGKSNLRRYQEIIARKEAMVANESKSQTQDEAQAYEASTIAGETIWQDSGLGTSVPTFSKYPSSYVPSRRSSTALKNPDWIPKLTVEAVAGHAFECFGCGKMVVIKKDVDWKKHLIKDLSPYNCTAPDCTDAFTLFSEKHEWIRHMKTEHEAESIPQSQCCPLCLVNTHDEKEDFLSHLSTHLEEISVAALPRGSFDDSDSDDESSKDGTSRRLSFSNETAKEAANDLLEFWGYMFRPDKAPTRLFNALNHAMATYIIHNIGAPDVPWLTPQKLASFYRAVGGNYDSLFQMPSESISYIWQVIGCEHTLLPNKDSFARPSIPALTLDGFSRWQGIEMLLGPKEYLPFYQFALSNWNLINPLTNKPFPTQIPAESFPLEPDAEMDKWHKSCAAKLREEANQREREAYKAAAHRHPIEYELGRGFRRRK